MAVRDRMASADERGPLEKKINAIYKPRLQALGFDPAAGHYSAEPSETQLLRGELIRIVAFGGRDAEVRHALAQAADRSIDDPKALDPGIRGTAWGVAVQELGKPFADKITPFVFSSTDPHLRQDAVAGLADAEKSPVAEEARALVLDKRGDLQTTARIMFIQMNNPVTRQATWQWFGTNQDAVLARVPGMFQFFLAQLGDPLCSKAERAQFDAALGDRLLKVSGGELQVGRTREMIDDCAALKDKLAPELKTVLGTAQ